MFPGVSKKIFSSILSTSKSISFCLIRFKRICFFRLRLKKNLNSIQRDFIVLRILFELLLIRKKKVFSVGSSIALSKAFEELAFRDVASSINIILIFD